jgi:branched-chain amino acid transport system ATP-binding protein
MSADPTVDRASGAAGLDSVDHVPGARKPDAVLTATGVRRTFGGLVAVDVEHVEVQRNTITALIGPNGAGKTTFFNLLTGFDEPNGGTWAFDGRALSGLAPYKVARAGMVRTFQLTKALTRLTVMENMKLGAGGQTGKLDHMRDEFAGNLSGGQRKLLEMSRALMADPSMIMLDEPMAGVNPALKQSLLQHIVSLQQEGRTVLFVEHDMDMVHEISDWVVVMAEGQVIAEGTATSIGRNQDVIDAYLGAHRHSDLGTMDPRSTDV